MAKMRFKMAKTRLKMAKMRLQMAKMRLRMAKKLLGSMGVGLPPRPASTRAFFTVRMKTSARH